MKYKFIAIILISAVFLSFSFQKNVNNEVRPPGTVKIVENFFFDETELTNIDWREYVFWMKKEYGEDSKEYLSSLPDTTVWTKLDQGFNEAMTKNYFSHPSFNSYPVVGISYNQAVHYCKWRTDRVKEMWALNFGKDNVPNLEYRLPTKTEWALIANTGFKPLSKKAKRKYKEMAPSFFLNIKQEEISNGSFYTAPTRSFHPNKHGVYHLFGNVAEMTAEKGIAKGGGWLHDYDDVMSDTNFEYTEPTAWLGFRCVAEILE